MNNFHFLFLSIQTFDFNLIFGSFLSFLGPNRLFLGLWKGSKTVLGSTHVVEHFSFCMLPSILTFDFDFILGSFLTFWGPNGLFLGLRKSSKTVLGSTHVVEKFSFCMVSSILIFDFYLILGSFLTFGGPNGVEVLNCFGVYSCSSTTFIFYVTLNSDI